MPNECQPILPATGTTAPELRVEERHNSLRMSRATEVTQERPSMTTASLVIWIIAIAIVMAIAMKVWHGRRR